MFDEQHDGNPHGECAAEIHRLETALRIKTEEHDCCAGDLGAVLRAPTFERTDMELQELKALAAAVKDWGNYTDAWLDQSEDEPAAVVGHIDDDGNTYPVATVDCDQYYAAADSLKLAKFYAAANPEMVLRMIAMIEAPNVEFSSGHAPAVDESAGGCCPSAGTQGSASPTHED